MKFYFRVLSGELSGQDLVDELARKFGVFVQRHEEDKEVPFADTASLEHDLDTFGDLEIKDHPTLLLSVLRRIGNEKYKGWDIVAARILAHEEVRLQVDVESEEARQIYNALLDALEPTLVERFGLFRIGAEDSEDGGFDPGGCSPA